MCYRSSVALPRLGSPHTVCPTWKSGPVNGNGSPLTQISICNKDVNRQNSPTNISHSRLEITLLALLALLTLLIRSWLIIFEIPRHVYRIDLANVYQWVLHYTNNYLPPT